MRYLCPIFIILLLAGSCGESSNKAQIKSIVEEWQGKQIVLPEVMTDFMTGDTIDLSDGDFTILTYIDSIGCTQCKMKLSLWKEFLNSIDLICDYNILFLMIAYPSDLPELNYVLKQYQFEYPVYIDAGNKISKVNSFPSETLLQTFLIDKNKKVTAIGNPLHSPELTKLFKEIITGKISMSSESTNIVTISNNRISFGNIHSGEECSQEIVFFNEGNDTVRIEKVISSCDCTELSLPRGYIAPKSDLKAVVTFSGDSVSGNFERSIHVYFSDFDYPTMINVSGNIIQ